MARSGGFFERSAHLAQHERGLARLRADGDARARDARLRVGRVLPKEPNGPLVFGAGTVQWSSWGLDDNHDRGSAPPDVRMQQATVDLLADMGVQPATGQPGLFAATASTDGTPPSAAIVTPADGAVVASGGTVAISGTAADAGGGVVGGVEVSVDHGTTWHPANGRASWT